MTLKPPPAKHITKFVGLDDDIEWHAPKKREIKEHLRGRHNQKDHGYGGGGQTVGERNFNGEEKEAVKVYTKKEVARNVNGVARGWIPPPDPPPDTDEITSDLVSALGKSKLKRSRTLYRGMTLPNDAVAQLTQPGATFTEKGFVSTSRSLKVSTNYAEANVQANKQTVMINIRAKAGQNAIDMSPHTTVKTDKEVLLPKGTTFRVTQALPGSGAIAAHIFVEPV